MTGRKPTSVSNARPRCSVGQHADHVEERERVDEEEHEPEADEAADDRDVAVGARQQLARLPAVVEGEVEALDVRVEVVAHHRFHVGGGVGQHQPAEEGEPAVDGADGSEEQDDRLDAGPVAVRTAARRSSAW